MLPRKWMENGIRELAAASERQGSTDSGKNY
jgi:hypothetical protein